MQGSARLRLSPLPQRDHDALTHHHINPDDVISELSEESVECVLRSPALSRLSSPASSSLSCHAARFDDYDNANTIVLLQRRPSQQQQQPRQSHSSSLRLSRPRSRSTTTSERSKRSLPSTHSTTTGASTSSSGSSTGPSGALFASLLMRQQYQPPRATRRLSLNPHVKPVIAPSRCLLYNPEEDGDVGQCCCKDEQKPQENEAVYLVATEFMPPTLHSTSTAVDVGVSVVRPLVVTQEEPQQQTCCIVEESDRASDVSEEQEGHEADIDEVSNKETMLVEVKEEEEEVDVKDDEDVKNDVPVLHLSEEAYAALCATGVAPVQRMSASFDRSAQSEQAEVRTSTEEEEDSALVDVDCEATSPSSAQPRVCVVDEVTLCNVVPVLPRTFPLQMLAQQVVPCTVCIDNGDNTAESGSEESKPRWLPRLRAAQRSHLLQLLSSHRASPAEAMSVGHTLHFLTTSSPATASTSHEEESRVPALISKTLQRAHAEYLQEEQNALQARTARRHARDAVRGAVVEWCSGTVGYCSDVAGLFEEQRVRAERTFYLPPTAHPTQAESVNGGGSGGRDGECVVRRTPQLPPKTLRGAAQRQLARLRRFHHEERSYMASDVSSSHINNEGSVAEDLVSPERALYAHLCLSTTVLCPFIEQLHIASSPGPDPTAPREATSTSATSRKRARNADKRKSRANSRVSTAPPATAHKALLLLRPSEDTTNDGSTTCSTTSAAKASVGHGVALHACFPQLAQCLQRDALLTRQLQGTIKERDAALPNEAHETNAKEHVPGSSSSAVSWNCVLDTVSAQCVADVVLDEALLFGLAPAHAPYALRLLPPTDAFASLLHTALRTCIDAYVHHVLPRTKALLDTLLDSSDSDCDDVFAKAQARYTQCLLHTVWESVPLFVWTRLCLAWPQMPYKAGTTINNVNCREQEKSDMSVRDALLQEVAQLAVQHARQALAETADALLQHVLTALRPVLHRRTFIMYELLRILSSRSLRLAHRALVLRYRNWYYHTPSPAAMLQLLQHSALFCHSLRRAFPDFLTEERHIQTGINDVVRDNSDHAMNGSTTTEEEHNDKPPVRHLRVPGGKLHLALDTNTRAQREAKSEGNAGAAQSASSPAEAEDSNMTSTSSTSSGTHAARGTSAEKTHREYVPEAALLEPYYLDRFAAYVMQAYHTNSSSTSGGVQNDAAMHAACSGGAQKDGSGPGASTSEASATRNGAAKRLRGRPPSRASKSDEPVQPQLSHSYDDHALRAVLRSLKVKGRTMSLEEMDAYMRSRFTNGVP